MKLSRAAFGFPSEPMVSEITAPLPTEYLRTTPVALETGASLKIYAPALDPTAITSGWSFLSATRPVRIGRVNLAFGWRLAHNQVVSASS